MKRTIFLSTLVFLGTSITLDALDMFLPSKKEQKLFQTKVEKRQELVESLSKSIEKLDLGFQEFSDDVKTRLEVIKNKIAKIKEDLKATPEDEYLNKALALLNEWYQVVKNLQSTRDNLLVLVKEHRGVLSEYLKDTDQKAFKKEFLTVGHAYTFEDLTSIKEKTDTLVSQSKALEEQIKNTTTELENRKRAAAACTKEFEQKRSAHMQDISVGPPDSFALTSDHKKQIFALEEELYRSKKQLFELQQEEVEQKRESLRTKLFLTSTKIDILNDAFSQVKSSIRITESEVLYARSEHKKEQQALNAKMQEVYDPAREKIEQDIIQKRAILTNLAKRCNIVVNEDMSSWSKAPSATAESWLGYAEVGKLNDEILALQNKKDLLDAEVIKEEEKLRKDAVLIDIQDSFLKKDAGLLSSEEKISQEIHTYDMHKAKIKANEATIISKKNSTQTDLDVQKKAAENISFRIKEVEAQKEELFKERVQEYARLKTLLKDALQQVNNQVDILNKTLGLYVDASALLNKANEAVEFISLELESIRVIWQRPEYAISWAGFKRVIPDLERFIVDVHSRFTREYNDLFMRIVYEISKNPLGIILFILQLLVLCILFFLLRKVLITVRGVLSEIIEGFGQVFKTIGLLILTIINFIIDYFILISVWFIVLIVLRLNVLPYSLAYTLFYLISIPYLMVLSSRFIAALFRSNEWYGYQFVSKELQSRYKVIFSVIAYATVAIFFFRQTFILGNYPKSELPNILLAINFIILQISFIFFIGKEQILSIIPQSNDMWLWVREQIDQYYYLMLLCMVAIIVMMNPYVGFGKLVLYILTRIIYTIALIVLFIWLHSLLRRSSSTLFFQEEQDSVKERFIGAKTWYGVFIIGVLLSLLFFGAIIVSKIWGWPAALSTISNFSDILAWLKTSILLSNTENPISLYTFLHLLFFVVTGFIVSFLIKRFVLARIFDVLLVDAGIQYTVTSIMRYLVMLVAVIFGFNAVGLGQQMNFIITAVVFGIAWVVKEPVSDFFSYFIILVQRPVKIGDFIRVDSEITGVVRRITPRSVVLRRKNSTMIVVPNSYLMNRPIINWNYARGFIAMNDITVIVDYDDDPLQARDLLLRIVEENQFVLKNPKPVIRLDDFGDYGYVFMIRAFLSSNYTLDQWNIASDIRLQIVQMFEKEGIRLALPIRVSISKTARSKVPGSLGTDVKSINNRS